MKRVISGLLLAALAASFAGVAQAGADVQFAIIGDRTGSAQPGVYERVVSEIKLFAPTFLVSVGDQIEGYTEDRAVLEAEWDTYEAIMRGVSSPFYICPGNHDILNDVMEDVWRKRTRRKPNYSFDESGIHFVILDTGRWESSEEWLAQEGHRAWLEDDLAAHAPDGLTFVIYHKPFWYDTLAEGLDDPLHEIFKRHGVDAVFNGHVHVYGTARYDGIPYTIVGSSGGAIDGGEEWGSFFHWIWCTVRDGRLTWAIVGDRGIRDPEFVLVEDLKFRRRAETEYVRLASFPHDEAAPAAEANCRLALRNAHEAFPLRMTLQWDVPANWSIEPAEQDVDLAPGAGAELAFAVERRGGFYPLPHLRADYPYREGRVFHYDGVLPALREQKAVRLAAAPAIDGGLNDAAWAAAGTAESFCAPEGGDGDDRSDAFPLRL